MPSIANKVDAEQFFEANRLIQWYLDEPMPNPAEVPLYFLAQNARKYVKVVLSGEGADELFGGYPMYCQAVHFMDYEHKVPKALRKAAGTVASNCRTLRASTSWCAVQKNPGSAICAPTMFSWTRLNVTAA